MRMVGASDVSELGDIGRAEVDRQAQKRVAVVVTPDQVATWDHRKMLAGMTGGSDGQDGGA